MQQVEIRHFHLFCGLGGGARGFNRGEARVGNLEARFRCNGGVDVDPSAIKDFERLAGVPGTVLDMFSREQHVAFHGAAPSGDWREATPADIRRAAGNERPHIVFLSAPCLPGDGLVLTETGPREIQTIKTGDLVLTHKGRFRPVTSVGREFYRGVMHGIRINGTVDHQWFTDEHPIWVRHVIRNKNTGRKRKLGVASFIPAQNVRVGDRIGFPIVKERRGTARYFIDSLGDPTIVRKTGTKNAAHDAIVPRITDLRPKAEDVDLWFLIGCYLGDGYRRRDGQGNVVNFCVGAHDGELADLIRHALDRLGISYSVDHDGGPNNVKIKATGRHLHAICGTFGDGAENKRLPELIMALEDDLLDALIGGYFATDGSEQSRRVAKGNTLQARRKIASVSLQLLRDFQRLLLRQGIFASVHKAWPGGPQTIMGRKVQTKPRWELNWRLDPQKRTVFEFADGAVWVRVREIMRRQANETVWNLSVKDDDTFCAPLMATHNCKGFSGLLSENRSKTDKYQALNGLTLRGVWLMLEAWSDDPPELIVFENVPRIATRGRHLLDQIGGMLRQYGYAVAETTHNCGELGGLSQSRKRFLLVARHTGKIAPFLYEPVKKPLRSVGELLGRFPLPGTAIAGPMHRTPALQWKTWVRLAFVEAGSDWRSLKRLNVKDGHLADYLIVPEMHRSVLGVTAWGESSFVITGDARPSKGKFAVADPRAEVFQAGYGVTDWGHFSGTIAGESFPSNGRFAVADPRIDGHEKSVQMGVKRWIDTAGVVTGKMFAGGGPNSVADPRLVGVRHNNVYRVARWEGYSPTVTAGSGPTAGGLAIADPRRPSHERWSGGKYRVTHFGEFAGAVIAASTTGNGAFAVADPRPGLVDRRGVQGDAAGPLLPAGDDRLVAIIRAEDGTWHRPFTTLELAALQGLVDPDEHLELEGLSDTSWRERIGNAVPPPAAQAIASVMGRTLLAAWSGESFMLSAEPIWVRPIATALSVAQWS